MLWGAGSSTDAAPTPTYQQDNAARHPVHVLTIALRMGPTKSASRPRACRSSLRAWRKRTQTHAKPMRPQRTDCCQATAQPWQVLPGGSPGVKQGSVCLPQCPAQPNASLTLKRNLCPAGSQRGIHVRQTAFAVLYLHTDMCFLRPVWGTSSVWRPPSLPEGAARTHSHTSSTLRHVLNRVHSLPRAAQPPRGPLPPAGGTPIPGPGQRAGSAWA